MAKEKKNTPPPRERTVPVTKGKVERSMPTYENPPPPPPKKNSSKNSGNSRGDK